MTFTSARIAAFAAVVTFAMAATMAVPQPYREGIGVERTTGRPVPTPWRQLDDLRQSGDLSVLAAGLQRLRKECGASPLLQGLQAMVAHETGAPDFAAAPRDTALVESYFEGVARPDAVDARAARLQRRLARGRPASAGEMLALAARYRQLGRTNSQWRWLSRTFARHRESTVAADGLVALCIAHGRLAAAVDIAGLHTADRARDLGWQRRLASLGAWLSRPELEIRALERIVALEPDPLDRTRLISLYAHLGTPERALPHAIALADGAAEIAAAEEAAGTALRAGFADEGLAMLQRAAARAPSGAPWLQRFADYALQDLRLAEVQDALAAAAELDPLATLDSLEDLYRRTDRPAELADVLQRRLSQQPGDARLWQELITLRYGLGQTEPARLLTMQRDAALADPESFVLALPAELRVKAGAVRQKALALSLANTTDGAVIGETIELLRPFLVQAEFRNLAEMLLTQHPNDPRAKPMRRELVDTGRAPLAAAHAAAALAATYPDDIELVRFWLERATWADLVPMQVAARQQLASLAPDDLDNHYALGELLEFTGEGRAALAHWQHLVAREGPRSRAVPRLVETLFALGDEEAAVDWLQRLAADPQASNTERLLAADELFFRRRYDRAGVLYAAVLGSEPEHPQALLRMGQIAAWTNDPRTARPFFERRLAVTDEDAALVRFYLGETLWALGETRAAHAVHAQALAGFAALPAKDFTARSCMATMLARLGEKAAALAAYRDLVARSPRDVDLVLDYADVVLQDGDLPLARALAGHAEVLAPEQARVLRLTAATAARSGDFATADRTFERILAAVGADATLLGDQTQVRLDAGNWTGAHASAERWLEVQPDSLAAQRVHHEARELLASVADVDLRHRSIGRDRLTAATIGGTWSFDEHRWLQGRLATVSQRGVTTLGSGEATADYERIDAAFGWRPGRSDRLLLGLSATPGVEGDTPVGVFAAGHITWSEPQTSVSVHLRWHQLWDDPMAAPGLGGRQSGIDAASQTDLGAGCWVALHGGLDWLEIDPAGGVPREDMRVRGDVSLGVRLIDGDVAVASPFDPHVVPAGPDSPYLAATPDTARPWLCHTWIGWRAAHLLGDAALAGPLPLLHHDDYAYAAGRLDHHVARSFGMSANGYAGVDLHRGSSVYGVEAALTWRPTFGSEFTLSGSHGAALGRSDGGDVEELRLQVVLRW